MARVPSVPACRLLARILACLTLLLPLLPPATRAEESSTKQSNTKVRLQLINSRLRNPVQSDTEIPPDSYFFKGAGAAADPTRAGTRKGWYRDVYPGIDLVLYGDDYNLEYVFVVNGGADPAAIAFQLEGQTSLKQSHAGNITFGIEAGEISMYKPSITLEKDGQKRAISSGLDVSAGNIKVDLRGYLQETTLPLNGSQFNLVKGGGQPGGPTYDFYIAKMELTHEQLMTFLNEMEEQSAGNGIANLVIDADGNAWMSAEKKPNQHEIFTLRNSKLVYDASKKAGARFSHAKDEKGKAAYARTPASGLSWFGCVKYCNWLTMRARRSVSDLCYNEGTEPKDWRPVTATNWAAGEFSAAERSLFVQKKGFRMPMLDSDAENITTNLYNEFYKAAAWDGVTNRQFGFGRDQFTGMEANFADTTNKEWTGAAPVGYFDGIARLGKKTTKPSANYFGIHDTSGNAAEWLNDPGKKGNPNSRCVAGGAYDTKARPLTKGALTAPTDTTGAKGLRPITTYMPKERLFIHVLFSFYMTPKEEIEEGELEGMDVEGGEGGGEEVEEISSDSGTMGDEEKTTETESTQPTVDTVTSDIIPDAVTYTEDPDEAVNEREDEEEEPPAEPPPGGDEDEPAAEPPPVVTPPTDVGPRDPTLFIYSSNPSSGVDIIISSTNLTNSITATTSYSRTFSTGTVVTLGAPQYAPNGAVFEYWNSSDDSYDTYSRVVTFTMPQSNITFTAVYRSPVTLTVGSISPDSGINIIVSEPDIVYGQQDGVTEFQRQYWPGTTVTLTAPTNAPGVNANAFHHWIVDGVSTNLNRTITITINNDMRVDAIFAPHLLRVRSSGAGDGIAITLTPADYFGDGSATSPYDRYYDHNIVVTLTTPATAANGNVFQSWLVDGVNVSTNTTTSIVMDSDVMVTAIYVYMPGSVTDPTVSPGGI